MALDLNRKIGPLKLKTWGIVGAGTFGLVWYATRGRGGAADVETASDLGEVSDPYPAETGGYFPATGGGGFGSGGGDIGYDPNAYFADLAPLEDLLVTQSEQLAGIETAIEGLATPAEVVEPPNQPPPGSGNFAERIARLRARRVTLKEARRAADTPKERKAIAKRVQKTQRTLKQVRAARAQSKRR